ncbi:MAG TPA: TonB family protein [Terriglobales bacterium]|jgi:TonB family protein|nr:TonB family protein [Terriglobales bacterium]
MRNRLRFRPDPFDYSLLTGIHKESAAEKPVEPEPAASISQIANALSVAGGGASSTDLALDLVLHEIAEQVRLSIAATGVAIALTRAGELVCRATTGGAPDLGLRLDPHSGLSGLCLQTKRMQQCDDTEMDSRVDSAACRELRVRSILVAPVVATVSGDGIGIVEAFSANPNHFRDRDAETLMSFCKRIVHTIDSAQEVAAFSELRPLPSIEDTRARMYPSDSDERRRKSRLSDRWTMLLTAAVVTIALVLGWMIGLADRRKVAIRHSSPPKARTQQESQAASVPTQTAVRVDARAAAVSQPRPILAPTANLSKTTHERNPSGGLIVYQNGKVIFREVPHGQSGKNQAQPTKAASVSQSSVPSVVIPAAKTELLTPEDANQYVTNRVQPVYPELARKQRVQGAVVLKVLVGKDGGVQQVQVISGDPKLASAAADAVVQWRFRPFLAMGQPAEFQTQVTVDFKLP